MTEVLTRNKPPEDFLLGKLEEIGSAVGQSLISLSDEFNARRHLFINQVDFTDSEAMMEAERKDTPPGKRILYHRLLSAGVPKEDLLKDYQHVSVEQPLYLNPEKPLLMVSRTILYGLLSPSEKIRTQAALDFASILGRAIIFSLPYLDNPYMRQGAQNIEWRLRPLVKDEFFEYWDYLKNCYKNKETKMGFNKAEKKLDRLFTHDISQGAVRFIPVGATISMLLPGQTLATSEYTIGKSFDEAVVSYINREAMQGVTAILQKKRVISSYKEKNRDSSNSGLVKVLLKRIGLPRLEDVICAHQHSDIVLFYLASEHPKVNPYIYPK